MPLIEKAYAKLHGCYESLISGFVDDGLAELTGFVAEKLTLHSKKTGTFPSESIKDKDAFWDYLKNRMKEKSLMGCSRSSTVGESEVIIDKVKTGIIAGHAYGMMDIFELPDEAMVNPRKTHRLLRVRNPWGEREWLGKWGD